MDDVDGKESMKGKLSSVCLSKLSKQYYILRTVQYTKTRQRWQISCTYTTLNTAGFRLPLSPLKKQNTRCAAILRSILYYNWFFRIMNTRSCWLVKGYAYTKREMGRNPLSRTLTSWLARCTITLAGLLNFYPEHIVTSTVTIGNI